jgi:hypothetical protein
VVFPVFLEYIFGTYFCIELGSYLHFKIRLQTGAVEEPGDREAVVVTVSD